MKFAFDVDGVITDAPDFFKAICTSLRRNGHEVHLVTDHDEYFRKQRIKELNHLGIEYDHLEITSDKEGYCKEKQIDFVVDDNMQEYFPGSISVPISILELEK